MLSEVLTTTEFATVMSRCGALRAAVTFNRAILHEKYEARLFAGAAGYARGSPSAVAAASLELTEVEETIMLRLEDAALETVLQRKRRLSAAGSAGSQLQRRGSSLNAGLDTDLLQRLLSAPLLSPSALLHNAESSWGAVFPDILRSIHAKAAKVSTRLAAEALKRAEVAEEARLKGADEVPSGGPPPTATRAGRSVTVTTTSEGSADVLGALLGATIDVDALFELGCLLLFQDDAGSAAVFFRQAVVHATAALPPAIADPQPDNDAQLAAAALVAPTVAKRTAEAPVVQWTAAEVALAEALAASSHFLGVALQRVGCVTDGGLWAFRARDLVRRLAQQRTLHAEAAAKPRAAGERRGVPASVPKILAASLNDNGRCPVGSVGAAEPMEIEAGMPQPGAPAVNDDDAPRRGHSGHWVPHVPRLALRQHDCEFRRGVSAVAHGLTPELCLLAGDAAADLAAARPTSAGRAPRPLASAAELACVDPLRLQDGTALLTGARALAAAAVAPATPPVGNSPFTVDRAGTEGTGDGTGADETEEGNEESRASVAAAVALPAAFLAAAFHANVAAPAVDPTMSPLRQRRESADDVAALTDDEADAADAETIRQGAFARKHLLQTAVDAADAALVSLAGAAGSPTASPLHWVGGSPALKPTATFALLTAHLHTVRATAFAARGWMKEANAAAAAAKSASAEAQAMPQAAQPLANHVTAAILETVPLISALTSATGATVGDEYANAAATRTVALATAQAFAVPAVARTGNGGDGEAVVPVGARAVPISTIGHDLRDVSHAVEKEKAARLEQATRGKRSSGGNKGGQHQDAATGAPHFAQPLCEVSLQRIVVATGATGMARKNAGAADTLYRQCANCGFCVSVEHADAVAAERRVCTAALGARSPALPQHPTQGAIVEVTVAGHSFADPRLTQKATSTFAPLHVGDSDVGGSEAASTPAPTQATTLLPPEDDSSHGDTRETMAAIAIRRTLCPSETYESARALPRLMVVAALLPAGPVDAKAGEESAAVVAQLRPARRIDTLDPASDPDGKVLREAEAVPTADSVTEDGFRGCVVDVTWLRVVRPPPPETKATHKHRLISVAPRDGNPVARQLQLREASTQHYYGSGAALSRAMSGTLAATGDDGAIVCHHCRQAIPMGRAHRACAVCPFVCHAKCAPQVSNALILDVSLEKGTVASEIDPLMSSVGNVRKILRAQHARWRPNPEEAADEDMGDPVHTGDLVPVVAGADDDEDDEAPLVTPLTSLAAALVAAPPEHVKGESTLRPLPSVPRPEGFIWSPAEPLTQAAATALFRHYDTTRAGWLTERQFAAVCEALDNGTGLYDARQTLAKAARGPRFLGDAAGRIRRRRMRASRRERRAAELSELREAQSRGETVDESVLYASSSGESESDGDEVPQARVDLQRFVVLLSYLKLLSRGPASQVSASSLVDVCKYAKYRGRQK